MRDPWALDPIGFYPTVLNYRYNRGAMERFCLAADAVVANTPRSRQAIANEFGAIPSERLFCVMNGWDREDFHSSPTGGAADAGGPLTIAHTGAFHTRYAARVDSRARKLLYDRRRSPADFLRYCPHGPNLLARTPYYLFKAVRLLLDDGSIRKSDVRMIFAGKETPEDTDLAKRFGLQEMVEFTGYVDHDRSVSVLESANVALLVLHDPGSAGFPLIVPGKTYEYMAARKPILALVPPGDARDFTVRCGLGIVCEPADVGQIARTVKDLIDRHKAGRLRPAADEDFIEGFERNRLAGQFAGILDFAISNRRG
jgi:glycosyltransferase involved in cell wall biosynthesis